jgi:hypothetical protein
VNLKAFERRFSTILSHISRSTYTGSASGGQSTSSCKPAACMAERKLDASSVVREESSVGVYDAFRRPASRREKSSSEFTSFSSRKLFR